VLRPFCVWGGLLTSRQVGKVEDLVRRDFFRDAIRLAHVADDVGTSLCGRHFKAGGDVS
jgi:hypothetical protein